MTGQSHPKQHKKQSATDETARLSRQQSAQQKGGGEADSPATWSPTDSSEPVTNGRNNCIKVVQTIKQQASMTLDKEGGTFLRNVTP
jgi:hypothetical protein